MSTVIKIKSSSNANEPAADALAQAEQAYSYQSDKLFIGKSDGSEIQPIVIGGKHFTDMLDHAAGTTIASSALIVDSGSKLDELTIGTDAAKLYYHDAEIAAQSTEANLSITLSPKGTGVVNVPDGYKDRSGFSDDSLVTKEYVDGSVAGVSSSITVSDGTTTDNFTTGNTLSILGTANQVTATVTDESGSSTDNATVTLSIPANASFDTSGNAATATALASGQNFSLTGDVTATAVSFDGSGAVELTTVIAENSVALGTDTTGNYVATASGTANEIEVTGSGSETAGITIGLPDDVTIGNNLTVTGNLTVDGTTTTVNSTTTTLQDPVIGLGGGEDYADLEADDGKDRGVEFKYFKTSAKTGFFGFDEDDSSFTFIPDATDTTETYSGTLGDAKFGNLALDGSITKVDGAAPTAGQLLIGNGTDSDMQLATLTEGSAIGITNADGSITVAADTATSSALGVAMFPSAEFTVSAGSVAITTIDGGSF